MSLTLTLDPHSEELIAAHLQSGLYQSAEEVVTRALETLAGAAPKSSTPRTLTPAQAVADIRELRKGITLGGLSIRELIDEGRKY